MTLNSYTTMSIAAGVFILALVISGLLLLNPPAAKKRPGQDSVRIVDAQAPQKGDYAVSIAAMGQVIPAVEVDISPMVTGQIVKVSSKFTPGGVVKRDEVLAEIDARDYQLALRRQAAALQQADSDVLLEAGRRRNAEKELEIVKQSRQLSAEDQYLILRGPQAQQVVAAQARAQADYEKAQLDLARTRITAPFNAIITQRMANLGSQLAQQQTIATLASTDEFWLRLNVSASDLPWLRFGPNGSQAHIAFNDERGYRSGYVSRMEAQLDSSTRLVPIIVAVPDPLLLQASTESTVEPVAESIAESIQAPLLLGDYLRVTIEGKTLTDIYRLQRAYLREGDTVWVARDGQLLLLKADVIYKDHNYIYFNATFESNDQIVISDLATPMQGMPVSVKHASISTEASVANRPAPVAPPVAP